MTIFTLWFQNLNIFDLSTYGNLVILIGAVFLASLFVFIFAKAAFTAEGHSRWTRRITGPNGKWFFGLLFILWAVVFGVGLSRMYGLLAPTVTGTLNAGPPAYDFEIWLASSLLSVTFPFLIFYAEFFQYWPLAAAPRAEAARSTQAAS